VILELGLVIIRCFVQSNQWASMVLLDAAVDRVIYFLEGKRLFMILSTYSTREIFLLMFRWCLIMGLGGWVDYFRWLIFKSDVFVSLYSFFFFHLLHLPLHIIFCTFFFFGSCKEMRERGLELYHEVKNDTNWCVSRTQTLWPYKVFYPLEFWDLIMNISFLLVPVLQYFYHGLVNVFQLQKEIWASGLKFNLCIIILLLTVLIFRSI
jgi:hypothetical protein